MTMTVDEIRDSLERGVVLYDYNYDEDGNCDCTKMKGDIFGPDYERGTNTLIMPAPGDNSERLLIADFENDNKVSPIKILDTLDKQEYKYIDNAVMDLAYEYGEGSILCTPVTDEMLEQYSQMKGLAPLNTAEVARNFAPDQEVLGTKYYELNETVPALKNANRLASKYGYINVNGAEFIDYSSAQTAIDDMFPSYQKTGAVTMRFKAEELIDFVNNNSMEDIDKTSMDRHDYGVICQAAIDYTNECDSRRVVSENRIAEVNAQREVDKKRLDNRVYLNGIKPEHIRDAQFGKRVGIPFDLAANGFANLYVKSKAVMPDIYASGKQSVCLDKRYPSMLDMKVEPGVRAEINDNIVKSFGAGKDGLERVRIKMGAEDILNHKIAGAQRNADYVRAQREETPTSGEKSANEAVYSDEDKSLTSVHDSDYSEHVKVNLDTLSDESNMSQDSLSL